MNKNIKRIFAALSAAAVIGTAGISASAATKEDVVAAARGAGFLEEYVQMLQNYLNTTTFSSSQYDIMVEKFYSVGSEMDEVAMQYFGKTVAQMKGEAEDKARKDGKAADDSWLREIAKKMDNKNVVNILNEIVDTGKQLGLDVSVEKLSDKNYTITVKDKDGNVQLVTPVGKLVDTTGAAEQGSEPSGKVAAVCAGLAGAGCIAAYFLVSKCEKDAKKTRKKNG